MYAIATMGLLYGLLAASAEVPPAATNVETPAIATTADDAISVEVLSGRTFLAAIDPRTDAECLWLRWQEGAATLLRPIRWDRVVKVSVAGTQLSGQQLQSLVRQVKAEAQPAAPEVVPRPPHAPLDVLVLTGPPAPNETGTGSERGTADHATESRREVPVPVLFARVRSLAIDAAVGRWDANVEATGIVVRIYPLDADGRFVPVDGTLEVELIGQGAGPVTPPQPFGRLGHWSERVRPADFGADGAVYRLPFQAVQPEFDLGIASRGAVHARLSVPGHGTFEATSAMVRIRPYSSVRDHLQQSTGRRFFPQETTGDGRH